MIIVGCDQGREQLTEVEGSEKRGRREDKLWYGTKAKLDTLLCCVWLHCSFCLSCTAAAVLYVLVVQDTQ